MTPNDFLAQYFDQRNLVDPSNPLQSQYVSPWIERIKLAPSQSAILPWVERGQATPFVTYFGICFSGRQRAELTAQIGAFLGRGYSNFSGRPATLDRSTHPDPLVAAVTSGWGFRFEVPLTARVTARDQLQLLLQTVESQPPIVGLSKRPVDQLLRDFHVALLARNRTSAEGSLADLRDNALLDAHNCLFLRVQMLDALNETRELLSLENLGLLCKAPRPVAVTQALLNAVYRLHFSECTDAHAAIDRFESAEIAATYAELLSRWQAVTSSEAKVCLALANAAAPPNWIAVRELTSSPGDGPCAKLLDSIHKLLPVQQPTPPDFPTAKETGDFEAAFRAIQLHPQSLQRCRTLFSLAKLVDTASAHNVAIEELGKLAPDDRSIIEKELQDSVVSRGNDAPIEIPEAIPTSWIEWLKRLNDSGGWPESLDCAATGRVAWTTAGTLNTTTGATLLTEEILKSRDASRADIFDRALPHLVRWLRDDESWPNPLADGVYEAVLMALLVRKHPTLDDLTVFNDILGGVLATSRQPSNALIKDLVELMRHSRKPRNTPWALELIESLIPSLRTPVEATPMLFELLNWFRDFPTRIDPAYWRIAKQLASEVGFGPEELRQLEVAAFGETGDQLQRQTSLANLGSRRVLLYTLTVGLAESVQRLITDEAPEATVWTSNDHGGSNTLRQHARNADFALVAWSSAKHAATNAIKAERAGRTTTMVAGKSRSSFITALLQALA